MSVINKMLKDLDDQQRQRIVRPNLTSAALPQQGPVRRNWWWLVLPLSLALLVASWVGLWPKLQARMTQPTAATADAVQSAGREAEPIENLPDVVEVQASETALASVPTAATPVQPMAAGEPEPNALAMAEGHSSLAPLETTTDSREASVPAPPQAVNDTRAAAVPASEEAMNDARVAAAPAPLQARHDTKVAPAAEATASVSESEAALQSRKPPGKVEPKPQPVMLVSPAKLSPQQQAQLLYQQARDGGELEGLRQALALDAQLHPARVLLAQRLAQRDPGQAMVLLAEASGRYPGQPEYPLTAAELALGAGDRQQAKLWLGQLGQQPLPLPLVARRAVLARELSMLTLAVSDYQGLVNVQPQEGRWWLGLAHSLDRLGRYGDAVSAYRRGLATGSLSDSARLYIEQRLQQLGDAG